MTSLLSVVDTPHLPPTALFLHAGVPVTAPTLEMNAVRKQMLCSAVDGRLQLLEVLLLLLPLRDVHPCAARCTRRLRNSVG